MRILTNVTNDYKQKFAIITEDLIQFTFYLRYVTNGNCWFYFLTYGNWSINNQRLTTHPNFLRQFSNILPFGMSCVTLDGTEAFAIDDFLTGRAQILLLTATEVDEVEASIYGD